jgi:hypothetical protein
VTRLTVSFRSLANAPNNAEALLVASKETGLDVGVEKTKYMVMSTIDTNMEDKITTQRQVIKPLK